MTKLNTKTALVIDHGIYPHVAVKLAEEFGKVLYFTEWVTSAFPSSTLRNIGRGLAPNMERVYSWLTYVNDVDLVVCPDVYSWDVVEHCRSLGKPTWGAARAESLELERWATKGHLKTLNMPIVPAILIQGIDGLRDHLQEIEDRYIKTSVTRGDFETFHHVNYGLTKDWLDDLTHRLGPRQSEIEFIVEEPVAGCEIGYDGFSVNGRFPYTAMMGWEIKDAGYLGKVITQAECPPALSYVNEKLADTFAALGLRGFYSNEIRIADDGTPYLVDPTMRCGSPPSESYIELFSNWPDVIWAGAHGDLVDLEPVAKFAAQIVLKSDWVAENKFLPVHFPPHLTQWVKLHNSCVLDGQAYVVPQDFPEFGAVLGLGNTIKEATELALKRAAKIEALDMRWQEDVFDQAEKCIEAGRKVGINF